MDGKAVRQSAEFPLPCIPSEQTESQKPIESCLAMVAQTPLPSEAALLQGRQIEAISLGKSFLEPIERLINQWLIEAPKIEKSSREKVKNLIGSFLLHNDSSSLLIKDLEVTSLPNIFGSPCFGKRVKKLDLSDNQLQVLPESVAKLTSLQVLRARFNQIKAFPEPIERLRSLAKLDLANNQIESISESITHLGALKVLNLSDNQIEFFPSFIGSLTKLKKIDLSDNLIQQIPDSIEQLQSLTELALSFNELFSIPESIGNLTALECLYLSTNRLRTIPESIGNLLCLSELILSENHIQTIPASIGNLSSLKMLDLSDNPLLTSLPQELVQLPSFCCVDIEDCGLSRKILERVQKIYTTPGYRGPQVSYSIREFEEEEMYIQSVHKWLYLEIEKQIGLEDPPDLTAVATLLLRGTWIIQQIEELAKNKISSLPFVEEVEIFFSYFLFLKEKLRIPITVKEGIHKAYEGLDTVDLVLAEESILQNLQDREKVCEFLSSQELWINALCSSRLLAREEAAHQNPLKDLTQNILTNLRFF